MTTPADLGLPSRFTSFRSYPGFDQLQLARDLATNTAQKRFSLLQGPAGSGKSLLMIAVGKLCEEVQQRHIARFPSTDVKPDCRIIYLVGTKSLQEQLMADFGSIGMQDVRGHRNYPCAVRVPAGINPDDPEYRCATPNNCQHKRDIEAALAAPAVVTNYAYWMTIAKYASPDLLGEFDMMVLDEAHTAPGWLTDFVAVTLDRQRVYEMLGLKLPAIDPSDLGAWADWAGEACAVCARKYKEGERSLQRLKMLGKDLRTVSRLTRTGYVSGLKFPIPDQPTQRWIGMETEYGVKFSPVWGSDYAEQYLFRDIPRVLLCSATLTPETGDYLGIPRAESNFIEIPSPFEVQRRPIIYVPTVNVDFRMTSVHKTIMVNRLDAYIESRLELGKGIIHSRSYAYAREIMAESVFRQIMIGYADSKGFRTALRTYMENDGPCILVGPSFEEGVSFDGALARWQVIWKVQVIDSRDPMMQARIKADKRYRDVVTMDSIMQMAGRVMRSADDWGETAIFDQHWGHVQHAYAPSWFKASWKKFDVIPPPMVVKRVIGQR